MRWLFEAASRQRSALGSKGMAKELMSPDAVPGIQMMRIVIQPGAAQATALTHSTGAKCGTVLTGLFGLQVDGGEYVLAAGESFAFGATSSTASCEGNTSCEVMGGDAGGQLK